MATSSLLEHIRVNNPKAVEEFVAAMNATAETPLKPRTENECSCVITDKQRLRNFMKKALQNKQTKK